MEKLRVLDLFSGIGGFSLGLECTGGFETVAFCEIDEPACRVLSSHWPETPIQRDVTTYEFSEGEADVITAGFPCQDLSFAGAGAGLAGARSGLYRHVIRAICVVRPARAVLENVAALLSRGLGTVLGDLAEVGYDAEWHCIPASAVGAPHRRDRIWIIADAGGEQHESCRAPLSGPLSEELSRSYLANTDSERVRSFGHSEVDGPAREDGGEAREQRFWPDTKPGCEDVADATSGGWEGAGHVSRESGQAGQSFRAAWWAVEPDVGRVAHGVPGRVDRLRCLGNSVVPQIPELIGNAILRSMREAA